MAERGWLARQRHAHQWLDHVLRANKHLGDAQGNRLAGAVTFFGFLSVFPILALAFSVLGYVVANDSSVQQTVADNINSAFPGLVGPGKVIDIATITKAKAGAGVIGLVGLLLAGLGWVDALRSSVRAIWGLVQEPGNAIVRKAGDALALVVLGVVLAVSVGVSAVVGGAADELLRLVHLEGSTAGKVGLVAVGYLLTLLVDVLLFLYLLLGLPRMRQPARRMLSGCVLGAVAFEVLKAIGTWYVARTTGNPVYGTVAVAVGLLVWINLITRVLMFCAAWTATSITAGGPAVAVQGAEYGAPLPPPDPVPPLGRQVRRRTGHAPPIYDVGGFLVGVLLRLRRPRSAR